MKYHANQIYERDIRTAVVQSQFGVMNPNQLISVPEAQRRIHDPELTHEKGKALAAATLMECCEHDLHITLDDMLRCLDYGGGIASMGARCLYVRTGRDGLGWKTASLNLHGAVFT